MLSGFNKIDLADFIGRNRSFVSSPEYDNGIEVDYYLSEKGELSAEVHFGERSMGPPGHVHGGAMAAVLDEAMGIACWFRMLPVVTRTMTTNYLRMLPCGTSVYLRTGVETGTDNDVITSGKLENKDTSAIYATATGKYARLEDGKLGNLGLKGISTVRG